MIATASTLPVDVAAVMAAFTARADAEFADSVADVMEELGDLLVSKHRDYGPLNISRSPGGPLNGLRVRMHDKLARINNLVDSGAEAAHEPLRDSFLDLANYAVIGLMVIDGAWPE